jgi:hypothetical protein
MKILVENFKVECFETIQDSKLWLNDNKQNPKLMASLIYHGPFYGIPQNIKDKFKNNLLVSIKTLCYIDTQYIAIYK